jgi:hypothetical protein
LRRDAARGHSQVLGKQPQVTQGSADKFSCWDKNDQGGFKKRYKINTRAHHGKRKKRGYATFSGRKKTFSPRRLFIQKK